MKKKITLFSAYPILLSILLILTTQIIYAQEPTLNNYEYLKIKLDSTINFEIEKQDNWYFSQFELYSYLFPQTFNQSQYLNDFTTSKNEYILKNESGIYYLEYFYDRQNLKEKNTIENTFIIESVLNKPQIKQEISFPLNSIEPENEKYLQFQNLIDINDDVRTQASEIAKGETDVYLIASKIAKWIREDIKYNIETVFENPNQTSTQVFKSKKGVCREITNLFISMMRSLGIPSRVVTGYAYTDSPQIVSLIKSNWGGHMWSEVLIGNTWVPFDLTYDQYGFIDATHIILNKAPHLRENSYVINSTGYGFDIIENSLQLENNFEILNQKEKLFETGFEINLQGPKDLGFNSYGYIKVNAKNTKDYYQILFLNLGKTKEIELIEEENKMLIFKPQEEKEYYFRYKIPDLDPGYIYTFPFKIYNDFLSESFNITVKEENPKIRLIALPENKENNLILTENKILPDCHFLLDYPKNTINCSIKNPNNYEIKNINLCLNQECKETELKINEFKNILYQTEKFSENLTLKYNNITQSILLDLKKPEINYTYQIQNDTILIEYEIKNYANKLKTSIQINNKTINTFTSEKEKIKIIKDAGNHTINIKLTLSDKILDETEFVVEIKKQKKSFLKKITNILSKLINPIISLFK